MTEDAAIGDHAERSAQGVIEVSVPDLETSLAFYKNLGFAIERRRGGFVSLTGHGCRLFIVHDPEMPTLPDRGCNLRIVVDDLDDIWALARKADCLVTREPGDRAYGLRDFSVREPAGFELRFAQLPR